MKPSYEERLAMAKMINSMPVKPHIEGQKFRRGWRVKVAKEMPPWMAHFESDFEAIVEYSYAQKFWGNDIKNYSLIMLKDGKTVGSIAWYPESTLTLISEDEEAGLKIIEEYEQNHA